MPDAWEAAHQLNAKDAADRAKPGAGGYPMLEVYLGKLVGKQGNALVTPTMLSELAAVLPRLPQPVKAQRNVVWQPQAG